MWKNIVFLFLLFTCADLQGKNPAIDGRHPRSKTTYYANGQKESYYRTTEFTENRSATVKKEWAYDGKKLLHTRAIYKKKKTVMWTFRDGKFCLRREVSHGPHTCRLK